jgi:2-phospho-L-lactate guanylyltransferase
VSVWIVLPVKRLDAAKSRLAPALSAGQRADVALRLLDHTLSAIQAAGAPPTVVVTVDRQVARLARAAGCAFLPDAGRTHSGAVMQGAAWATSRGARGVAALAADLPLLAPGDVRALLRPIGLGRVVVAPDRLGTGTNALGIAPPEAIAPSFGPDSFRRHLAAARRAGLEPVVLRTPGLALDLDRPDDADLCGPP